MIPLLVYTADFALFSRYFKQKAKEEKKNNKNSEKEDGNEEKDEILSKFQFYGKFYHIW